MGILVAGRFREDPLSSIPDDATGVYLAGSLAGDNAHKVGAGIYTSGLYTVQLSVRSIAPHRALMRMKHYQYGIMHLLGGAIENLLEEKLEWRIVREDCEPLLRTIGTAQMPSYSLRAAASDVRDALAPWVCGLLPTRIIGPDSGPEDFPYQLERL